MRRKWKEFAEHVNWPIVIILAGVLMFWALVGALVASCTSHASGPGYDRIEQTENAEVIELTERVAEIYPMCPELIQAIVFYESSNQPNARNGNCIGYMQVNKKYHKDRMEALGASDLTDGWDNILAGTDYLIELCEEYEDVATALMVYHGESRAVEKAEAGEISGYARKILELSEKLERLHEEREEEELEERKRIVSPTKATRSTAHTSALLPF